MALPGTLFFNRGDRLVIDNCGLQSELSTVLSHDGRGNYSISRLHIVGHAVADVRRLSVTKGFEEWLDIGLLHGDFSGKLRIFNDVLCCVAGLSQI